MRPTIEGAKGPGGLRPPNASRDRLVAVAEVRDLFVDRVRVDLVSADAAEDPGRVVALPELVGNSDGGVVELRPQIRQHDRCSADVDGQTRVGAVDLHRAERAAENDTVLQLEIHPHVSVARMEVVEAEAPLDVVDQAE